MYVLIRRLIDVTSLEIYSYKIDIGGMFHKSITEEVCKQICEHYGLAFDPSNKEYKFNTPATHRSMLDRINKAILDELLSKKD